MAIVETKITIRPNSSVPFFYQTSNPTLLAVKSAILALGFDTLENPISGAPGSVRTERTISDNTLTETSTFDTLTTWSAVDSIMSIELDYEFVKYSTENEFLPPSSSQYTLTGINKPFTCTTTYTYDPDTVATDYPQFDDFIVIIELHEKLTNLVNTGTQLIAVHTYSNADDFTENHWKDYNFIEGLHNGGVTRSIAYAML
jgi:hypothetical protein